MNSPAQLTRTERLDRLPVTPKHKRLLVGSGIGWALDAMDIGLVSFILAALAAQWNLDNTTTGWIASLGFVGMAVGASLGGLLADKIGRRQVFAATLLLYGLATGAGAAFGRIGSILAPLIVPPVLALGGSTAVFGVFAAAFALACVAAFTLPEQRGVAIG